MQLELIGNECVEFGIGGISNNGVIPTKAELRGGIFAPNVCYAEDKYVDPSTSFHSARDDRCIRNWQLLKISTETVICLGKKEDIELWHDLAFIARMEAMAESAEKKLDVLLDFYF